MPAVSSSRYLVMAGWDDVPHLSEQAKKELLDSTPVHLRKARSKGIPVLGSGAIFPIDEDLITEDAIAIPSHWPRICGMDFGWDHPTAAVWMAWDRDTDTLHIYDAYRVKQEKVAVHATAIRARGSWIPVSWPHDGHQHDKGSGVMLAKQYRDDPNNVNMLPEHAQFDDAPEDNNKSSKTSVEAGLAIMLDMMTTGRLKVARHINDWFEEFRLYHRKDGKVVKEIDDLMAATRYGIMMLRFAITEPKREEFGNRKRKSWRS